MANLIALRRGEPIFDRLGVGTRRFNEYIDELTSQVNNTTNEVGEVNTQIAQARQVSAQVSEIARKLEKVVVTDTDITAKPFDIVICNNSSPITIELEANPITGDIINIKRKNALVTVNAPIDGKPLKIINVRYYSMKLVYDGVEWAEI